MSFCLLTWIRSLFCHRKNIAQEQNQNHKAKNNLIETKKLTYSCRYRVIVKSAFFWRVFPVTDEFHSESRLRVQALQFSWLLLISAAPQNALIPSHGRMPHEYRLCVFIVSCFP